VSKNVFPVDIFQHYYLHDKAGQPLAVVAIGVGSEAGKIVRGISIRSDMDAWDRVKGRKRAVGRCRKALATKKCADPINLARKRVVPSIEAFIALYGDEYFVVAAEIGYNAVVKTGYDVPPTDREEKILAMLVKRLTPKPEPVQVVDDLDSSGEPKHA